MTLTFDIYQITRFYFPNLEWDNPLYCKIFSPWFLFLKLHIFRKSNISSLQKKLDTKLGLLNCLSVFFSGITNFDLLGDFGSVEWLGNFKIVLLYNILFAAAASLCIVNKFTAKVRRELYARLVENYLYISNCASFLN